MKELGNIALVFGYLSLLTVGGGLAAFPELKSLTVDSHQWLTFPQLLHFYSLGQLSPGPNMMMVASVGMWVAGPVGALLALVCFLLPTSVATFSVGRLWNRLESWRWRFAVQHGLGAVSVGLVLAGGITMARGAVTSPLYAVIAVVVFGLLLKTRINPAFPILGGGLVAVLAWRWLAGG